MQQRSNNRSSSDSSSSKFNSSSASSRLRRRSRGRSPAGVWALTLLTVDNICLFYSGAGARAGASAAAVSAVMDVNKQQYEEDGSTNDDDGRYDTTASMFCLNDVNCFELYGNSDYTCRSNRCSNNNFEQGCLLNKLPGWKKMRVCNSDDGDVWKKAANDGAGAADEHESQSFGSYSNAEQLCRKPELDYMEIRLQSQNWESAVFEAWIVQILLSEILDVPTTIETSLPTSNLNFYDPQRNNKIGVALMDDLDALRRASDLVDCRLADRSADNYESCAHVILETWKGQNQWFQNLIREGVIEPMKPLGVIGDEGWYIPKFAGERDPTLLSYLGLAGEENRRKMAETFLRPTTWKDYCDQVSLDNCATDDGVAKRAPRTEGEDIRMFVQGLFIGHFRKTDRNDCDKFPLNCTGHIADYPCVWSSFVAQQTYWLKIALTSDGPEHTSGGYLMDRMHEMWAAANATKSNLIMIWYEPDLLSQAYIGTDAEFSRVTLTPTSQLCIQTRYDPIGQCTSNETLRVGNPEGACDMEPNPLNKVISNQLYSAINDWRIPNASRSPAYDAINRFRINELQLEEIFAYLPKTSSPREAVCQWVVDNMDYMYQFVPLHFPRTLREVTGFSPLMIVSFSIACLAILLVLFASQFLLFRRKQTLMASAPIEYSYLLVTGLLLIPTASLIGSLPHTDNTCLAATYVFCFGISLELLPVVVMMTAVHRSMFEVTTTTTAQTASSSDHFRRSSHLQQPLSSPIAFDRNELLKKVFYVSLVLVPFLIAWALVDPLHRATEYIFTDQKSSEDGSTIVLVEAFCKSESRIWLFLVQGWNLCLLCSAALPIVEARRVNHSQIKSKNLATMIYSHFVFLILRLLGLFLDLQLSEKDKWTCLIILYSTDTIATVLIYIAPSFLEAGASAHHPNDYSVYATRMRMSDENARYTDVENDKRDCPSTNSDGATESSDIEKRAAAMQKVPSNVKIESSPSSRNSEFDDDDDDDNFGRSIRYDDHHHYHPRQQQQQQDDSLHDNRGAAASSSSRKKQASSNRRKNGRCCNGAVNSEEEKEEEVCIDFYIDTTSGAAAQLDHSLTMASSSIAETTVREGIDLSDHGIGEDGYSHNYNAAGNAGHSIDLRG